RLLLLIRVHAFHPGSCLPSSAFLSVPRSASRFGENHDVHVVTERRTNMTTTLRRSHSAFDDSATLAAIADLHEVIDALYRFAAGQDERDRELFESAFALDATVDFSEPASRFGVDLQPFVGR